MTFLQAMDSPIRPVLLTVLFLLITLQMYLIFAAFGNKRSWRIKGLYILHFIISFLFLYLALNYTNWKLNFADIPLSSLRFFEATLMQPAWVLYIYEGITALIVAFGLANLVTYRKSHLTDESIKETMDLLPIAIAFGRADGSVVFRNLTMTNLSRTLTGGRTDNLIKFWDMFDDKITIPLSRENNMRVTAPDQSAVWQVAIRPIKAAGDDYMQLTAMDITEQSVLTRELEDKNSKLRDIQMRLAIHNKQVDRIVIARELLNARMEVHNEAGNVLLESRHYLSDPESIDEEMLLNALKNTNTYLLREYEEDDTARDPLAEALELAEAIGVEVNITGVIPPEGDARSILAAAINECATNTVKHAQGDLLNADITKADPQLVFRLNGNGIPPEGTVRESGGLASLRVLVENAGGSMEISPAPDFHVTIILP